jgi:hypothetical protein
MKLCVPSMTRECTTVIGSWWHAGSRGTAGSPVPCARIVFRPTHSNFRSDSNHRHVAMAVGAVPALPPLQRPSNAG